MAKPIELRGRRIVGTSRHFGPEEQDAALAFARDLRTFLLPAARPTGAPPQELAGRIRRASWQMAGIAVLCDWLGSNESHFAYRTEHLDLESYWKWIAQPQAARALDDSGVQPLPVTAAAGAGAFLSPGHVPTPLQRYAETTPIGSGPQLFLLEDLTGAGKTEAALTLARVPRACGDEPKPIATARGAMKRFPRGARGSEWSSRLIGDPS